MKREDEGLKRIPDTSRFLCEKCVCGRRQQVNPAGLERTYLFMETMRFDELQLDERILRAGFEFACGIPGSVGGAVFMNAGAYDGEIKNVIKEAEVLDRDGNIKVLSKEELELGYRTSKVMKDNLVVISATFELTKGDKEKIRERVNELTEKRESKQPLEYPSAGSTFKRPEGYFAGKLIQDAGLKGASLGGAAVSEKHSGFVINKDGATAEDVLNLIAHVQNEVKKQFGVELHTEVRIIGEDK